MTALKKIALTGIDGAGKSTIMRRIIELAPLPDQDVVCLTCPQFHDTPDVPFKELSRSLDALSQCADQLGNFELKAAALFLQMTLYGPIEQCIEQFFHPALLLSERQPLIDTLAYGPFYAATIQREPPIAEIESQLISAVDGVCPGGYERLLRWLELHSERLGESIDLGNLALMLRELFTRPMDTVCETLKRHYQTEFPDAVVLLDPGVDVAIQRIAERAGTSTKELHESRESLEHLRHSYHAVIDRLGATQPSIKTLVIDTAASDVDTAIQTLLEKLALQAPKG